MNVFRAALSSDFWITGIAIARYIPRAFRTKQIDGNLFFTEEKRQEYRRRVESVTLNSRRKRKMGDRREVSIPDGTGAKLI